MGDWHTELDAIYEIKREAEEYITYQNNQANGGKWTLEEWEVKQKRGGTNV
jgi:hypothetical protein